jgi:hypothetical protein
MNIYRQIREKAMLAVLLFVAALNANVYRLYTVYRMIF